MDIGKGIPFGSWIYGLLLIFIKLDCALCGQNSTNDGYCDFNGHITNTPIGGAVAIGIDCEPEGIRIPTDYYQLGDVDLPVSSQCPEDRYYNGAPVLMSNGTVSSLFFFFFFFF